MGLAQQELRLISALVLILGAGLFLALPFVLSIGSVVFLPLVSAVVLTVLLSPLADKLHGWGLPNGLASVLSLLTFLGVLLFALALVLQPAIALFDKVPTMAANVIERFSELQTQFAWVGRLNEQLAQTMQSGKGDTREVVLAGPSVLQELAIATPTVVIEVLLTLLMTYFMIEARVRLRQRLLLGRTDFGTSIKVTRVLREVQERVAAYILTVGWINALVGIIAGLGAWALGVEAPIMWGGLAAILNFLPYIGPTIMVGLLALFGLGTNPDLLLGMIPALAYLGLHAVEANIFTPSILGARFTMNPVMILIALSYFSWIWGVLGALLSVPILLMLTALVEQIGTPNIFGFLFGEQLFGAPVFTVEPEEAESSEPPG